MAKTVKIYTAEDLRNFRDRVNKGENKLNATVMNDINITEKDEKGNPVSWVPIGSKEKYDKNLKELVFIYNENTGEHYYTDRKKKGGGMVPIPYNGIFDGKGHVISGLFIDPPEYSITKVFGLFGVNHGTIKNITVRGYIRNYTTNTSAAVGGICGENVCFGVIDNCVNQCTLEGNCRIGGIVGVDTDHGKIRRCTNHGTILGNCNVASGIAGYCHESEEYMVFGGNYNEDDTDSTDEPYITNCVNKGDLHILRGAPNFCWLEDNGYKFNQIGNHLTDNRDKSNKHLGKVVFPFQNSITGVYCYHFNNMEGIYWFCPDKFKELLMLDSDKEHINSLQQTYLHLICRGSANKKDDFSDSERNAKEMVTILASETSIDFNAKDIYGKTAMDYAEIPTVKELIEQIAHEQAEIKHAQEDDSFSTIGF